MAVVPFQIRAMMEGLTRKAPTGAWFGVSPNLSLLFPFGAPKESDVKSAYGRSARFRIALFRSLGKQMVPYVEDLSVEKLHVQAPTEIIFLCGGPISDIGQPGSASMRDAFLKILNHPAVGDREIILAEDITRLSVFSAHYGDILEFETHLAQITELILLFCESVGSFAELGSFAIIDEISTRLLVIIRDTHWKQDSFIKLGPLRYLQNRNPKSVFVIDDHEIGITGNTGTNIDLKSFRSIVDEPLRSRLEILKDPSTFDGERPGHVIKLIVGLVQEYGALEFKEICYILKHFNLELDEAKLHCYILCAQAVQWLEQRKKGFRDFLIAKSDNPAAHFFANDSAATKNRIRRRMMIREHWKENDPSRFSIISPLDDVVL